MSVYLFRGGSVRTMDASNPVAEAVVVADDRITYVGTESGASEVLPETFEVIDLAGGMLLPVRRSRP